MFFFIRHGQSNFNVIREKLRQKYSHQYIFQDQWKQQRFHQRHIDSPLSENGIKQAEECRLKMQKENIDIVVVSPLRRTLQTCDIIFKNHKSNPQIIVDPRIRQYIESSCDVGASLTQLIKQYSHFNFKKIKDPQAWYLDSIHDQQKKQNIFKKIQELEGIQRIQQAKKHGIEYIHWLNTILWTDFELQKKFKQKKQSQLNYLLQQYASQYPNKNIAIISHSENIKAYFKISPKNCEIISKNVDEIQQQIKKNLSQP